jgi:spore coat protein A
MASSSRRSFLRSCLTSVPGVALSARVQKLAASVAPAVTPRTPRSIDRFVDPLPIPPRIQPREKSRGVLRYSVRMTEFRKPLHSQLPPTRLWGYEGHYPGPTFEARRGQRIAVEWINDLPAQHLFTIDPHIHGAMPPAPAVRTVPHLHGARTSSISDGLPEKWFAPGQSVVYHYENDQQAAPLWYHDHALGITRLNVYAGLSGFYFLRDERELNMNLPSGELEIPLVLQDRDLDDEGQLVYRPTFDDARPLPPGVWGSEFFGALPVVNGAVYPYLEVEPCRYRLRLLNSCNSRFLDLYLNLSKGPTAIPVLVDVLQIGTDGGLLSGPVSLDRLLLAPAERADLIVDFSALEGKTITLANRAAAPYPGWSQLKMQYPPLYELMQFRVTQPLSGAGKAFSLPAKIDLLRYDPAAAVVTRDFVLSERMDSQGRSLGMHINGKGYDDPVTELPKLGSLEKWRFVNTTDDTHPMHLHLVQFQILERQGFDPGDFLQGKLTLVGQPRPPAPQEAGWKDTATVNPRDVLTILVRFEGYTGRYVFHCHMAEHEDNDMMRPYEVVAADAAVPS